MDCNSQAPQSMRFSREEYWSGLPFPSLGDFPDPGIEPVSPALAGRFFTTELPGKPSSGYILISISNLSPILNTPGDCDQQKLWEKLFVLSYKNNVCLSYGYCLLI